MSALPEPERMLAVPAPSDRDATQVVLTRPHPDVWMATVYAPPDNKMTAAAMRQLHACLDAAEAEWRRERAQAEEEGHEARGAAFVLASSNPKFFCNGLGLPSNPDLVPGFITETWETLKWRLVTYPMVTIAAINGHAFGGGLFVSLTCDIRIMTSGKGLLSANELLIGMPINAADCALVRTRLSPRSGYPGWVLRDIMLGKRWTQGEALSVGLIDEIAPDGGDREVLVRCAVARGVRAAPAVASGAHGGIKEGMYRHIQQVGAAKRRTPYPAMQAAAFWDRVEGKL